MARYGVFLPEISNIINKKTIILIDNRLLTQFNMLNLFFSDFYIATLGCFSQLLSEDPQIITFNPFC